MSILKNGKRLPNFPKKLKKEKKKKTLLEKLREYKRKYH